MLITKATGVLGAVGLAAAFAMAGPIPAAAAGSYTCSGGTASSPSVIPAGSYSSITVTGFCTPDTGTVTVAKSLTVAPGGAFDSETASSTVTIGGSLDVQNGGAVSLGCGPSFDTPCPEGADVKSNNTIHGNVGGQGAALLVLHFDTIGGNVGVQGGGGGLTCDNLPSIPTPPFVDFDSNTIGGNASVTGLETCWSGFSNNKIGGNADYSNNQTVIEDGNFVGGNTVARNLSCSGDSPAPHLSDVFPVPNSVAGHTSGQCATES